MQCPSCGGEMFDNRADKASGARSAKWPDFKCKDRNCNKAIWPPKGGGQRGGPSRPANGNGGSRGRYTWGQLSTFYGNSLKLAEKHVKESLARQGKTAGVTLAMENVLSSAATIFIAATKEGIIEQARQAPPPPPPPPPEPEPVPDFSDYPQGQMDDPDLPF